MKVVALASVVACVSAFAPAARPSTSLKMNGVKEDVAAAVLATVTIMSPVVANAGDITNGATIFAGNCAACHAGGNNVSCLLREPCLLGDALHRSFKTRKRSARKLLISISMVVAKSRLLSLKVRVDRSAFMIASVLCSDQR